jgi:BRCT domain type II-containing protein
MVKLFTDMTMAISGTLTMGRESFENLIKSNGGKSSSTVTKKTTHFITTKEDWTNPTSKINKAKENGIPIINENFVHDSIKNKKLMEISNYIFGQENNSNIKENTKRKREEEEEENKQSKKQKTKTKLFE